MWGAHLSYLRLLFRYACGLDFSPDGSYIVSGDSEGKLFFWDYVTAKNVSSPLFLPLMTF
jgi:WD40 repeat protein